MAELAENARRFKRKNANLVVIGTGASRYFEEFRQATGYKGELLTDPERKAFRMLGFSSGVTGLMSISSVPRAFSALIGGHRQGTTQGSTLQLGGAVVIDPSSSVRFFFAGKKAGHHPAINDLLSALDGPV